MLVSMSLFKKVFEFTVRPTHSRTAAIIVFIILIVAVPLTVFVSQKQQSIKQRASGQNCEANYTLCTNAYNECNQSCSNFQQGDYDTYYAYTQAYSACTEKCSNDESTCNTDAYYVYLQCLSSADSHSTSSVNPNPEISQEPSPTVTVSPTLTTTEEIIPPTTSAPTQEPNLSIPTVIPTNVVVQNSPTPSSTQYCYLKNKGDANCDDIINIVDLELWRTEFLAILKGIPIINEPSDFNSDGVISIIDFNIWKTSFADPSLPH